MKTKFLSFLSIFLFLLMLPSCYKTRPVMEENTGSDSEFSTTESVQTGITDIGASSSTFTAKPSAVSTTTQLSDFMSVTDTTSASSTQPSWQETSQTAFVDPSAGGVNSESNLALGGKMAFTDKWVYLIDKNAAGGGTRFSHDFSRVEEFHPENCNSMPYMEFAEDRIYYSADSGSESRIYSCNLDGGDIRSTGICMLLGSGGFRIINTSIYYINPQSVLMKADLNGGNQKAVFDLAPLKCSPADSRMAVTEDSLFLMLTSKETYDTEIYCISLKDDKSQRIYSMPFQSSPEYQSYSNEILIPCNGWLYFCGCNEICKISYDGKKATTIHVGEHHIDSMLIENGKLYYMEGGCMYGIALDNDTVQLIAYISPPFQHNGILMYDYANVRFLGCDENYIYMTRTEPLNVIEGSEITESRNLIERIQYDGNNQRLLFPSR